MNHLNSYRFEHYIILVINGQYSCFLPNVSAIKDNSIKKMQSGVELHLETS